MRTAENCNRRVLCDQKASAFADMVSDHLGFLRTTLDAFAAANTSLADDFGVITVYPDRLDRTVANTGVAFTAIFLDGYDRSHGSPGGIGCGKRHELCHLWHAFVNQEAVQETC
mgnify:CR=1 FL=1